MPKAAYSGLAASNQAVRTGVSNEVIQAACRKILETQLAGHGTLIHSWASEHLANSSAAGHTGLLVGPGDPAGRLAEGGDSSQRLADGGDASHRLAHSRGTTQRPTATGGKGERPAAGSRIGAGDTGGLPRGHLDRAGSTRSGLVARWLANSGLTAGLLTVVQEPGTRLEGAGQIDATQAVGIRGRNCGHWDSVLSSDPPGRAVPCGAVVGHGAGGEMWVTH